MRSSSSAEQFLEQESKQMEGGGDERSEYKKGLWTVEEDKLLMEYVRVHGKGKWNRIPKTTGLKRCGKSCRLRWMNYLTPGIKRGNFSEEEEDLIIRLHKLLGNRWSLIAGRVPGRTDNQVKNHWNTHLSKKPGVTKVNDKVTGTDPKLARVIRENLKTNALSHSSGQTSSSNDEGVGHVDVKDGGSQNGTFEVSFSEGIVTNDCYDYSFWFSNEDITQYSIHGLMGILEEPLDFLWHGL